MSIEFIQSPNMSLPVPITSVTPGPNYASDVNNCLGLIDQHDHSFGKGVLVTPNGLNINADLTIQNNNLTNIRATRFTSQASPITALTPDINEIYVSGADLYYNDGNNNIVRITQSGGVAGSPGSIANLVSPASASYNSGTSTFIWESGANIPAGMDNGPVTIRNITLGSNGITLQASPSLSIDYSITLPATLPSTTSFVTLDNSGNIGSSISTIQGITASNIANSTITRQQQALVGYQLSASCGTFVSTGSTTTHITNLSVTVTSFGNPIILLLQGGDFSGVGLCTVSTSVGGTGANLQIENSTVGQFVSQNEIFLPSATTQSVSFGFLGLDVQPAGTYTYTAQVTNGPGVTFSMTDYHLVAYEI